MSHNSRATAEFRGGLSHFLMKHDSKPSGGREARSSRDLRHGQIGVHQKILGAIVMRLANFVGDGMSDEQMKAAFEGTATQRDMVQNVVDL